MKLNRFSIPISACLLIINLFAFGTPNQNRPVAPYHPDSDQPLESVEKELMQLAKKILYHDSLALKIELNEQLITRLKNVLKRDDSYDYPFDSLKTISRIAPEDNSFRVFTWHIVDKWTSYHLYFGLIQRKYVDDPLKKAVKIAVIQLIDRVDYDPDVELQPLSPQKWLGALYYKPKNTKHGVLTYSGKFLRFDGISPNYRTEKIKYYVLLGWNGHNLTSAYKIIDVITFDPNDPSKIIFGAPIFYFTMSPKFRVIYKYSGNSSFNLNYNYVVSKGWFGRRKKTLMISFDHIAPPRKEHERPIWEYGADGTTDAFRFHKKFVEYRKGFFVLERDVLIYEPSMEKFDPKEVEKQVNEERKRLEQYNLMQKEKKKKVVKPKDEKPGEEKARPKSTIDGKPFPKD